jgi:alkanesulfonate monooxygenase SsuD/methylene tetrahydromethanopterin reductase-like flavin-dependent oxidoreductase (luciferase family)
MGRDDAELAAKQARFAGKLPGLAGIQGTPEQVIERLREYERAGSDDVMVIIPDAHEIEPLRLFGEVVIGRSVPG